MTTTILRNGIKFRRATRKGTPVEFWGTLVGYVQRVGGSWQARNVDGDMIERAAYPTRAAAANLLADRRIAYEALTNQHDPMPLRSVRVDDARWQNAQAQAERDGTTVSQVIRDALDRYTGAFPRE